MLISNKSYSIYNQETKDNTNILKYDANINGDNYLINIYPSKDNITIIFKIEKEKVLTYYYYEKFDLKDFKKRGKKFLFDENINDVFSTLKKSINKCSILLNKNLFKIFITLSDKDGYIADFTLRKKILSKYRFNTLLMNQIEFNNSGVDSLSLYSQNLKRIRTELRYTLEGMSNKLGVKTRTYVSWERENKMPPIELGTLLNEKLNINLNWFCTGKGEMFCANSDDKLIEKIEKLIENKFQERGL